MRQKEADHEAVTLLQQALLDSGFDVEGGADGKFGPHTAAAIVEAEKHFGFQTDGGVAGREVLARLTSLCAVGTLRPVRIGAD